MTGVQFIVEPWLRSRVSGHTGLRFESEMHGTNRTLDEVGQSLHGASLVVVENDAVLLA
jgi:hypothetical protein